MKNIFLPFHSPFDLPIPSGDRPKIYVGAPFIGPFSTPSSASTDKGSQLSKDSSVIIKQDQAIHLSQDFPPIIKEEQVIPLLQSCTDTIEGSQAVPEACKYKSNSSSSGNPFDLPLPSAQRPKIFVGATSIGPFSTDEASHPFPLSRDSDVFDQALLQGSTAIREEDQAIPLVQSSEEDQASISLKISWTPEVLLAIGVLTSCIAIALFARSRLA